jgi:hypothetical protein
LHNNSTAYVILQDMRSYVSEEIAVGTLWIQITYFKMSVSTSPYLSNH